MFHLFDSPSTHRGILIATFGVLLVSVTGCASATVRSSATPASVTTPGTASAEPKAALGTTPPKTSSQLPDGTYRTRITPADITRVGDSEPGEAGTWTLIAQHGTYTLACAPVSDPSTECGQDGKSKEAIVEAGWLRGGPTATVWMVHNLHRTQQLAHCTTDCGPMGGYRMTWRRSGTGLAFSDYVGLGDEAGGLPADNTWTMKPWTRIR